MIDRAASYLCSSCCSWCCFGCYSYLLLEFACARGRQPDTESACPPADGYYFTASADACIQALSVADTDNTTVCTVCTGATVCVTEDFYSTAGDACMVGSSVADTTTDSCAACAGATHCEDSSFYTAAADACLGATSTADTTSAACTACRLPASLPTRSWPPFDVSLPRLTVACCRRTPARLRPARRLSSTRPAATPASPRMATPPWTRTPRCPARRAAQPRCVARESITFRGRMFASRPTHRLIRPPPRARRAALVRHADSHQTRALQLREGSGEGSEARDSIYNRKTGC